MLKTWNAFFYNLNPFRNMITCLFNLFNFKNIIDILLQVLQDKTIVSFLIGDNCIYIKLLLIGIYPIFIND